MMFRLNKEQGMTVLLSSHLLYEVQQTCQRVGIIRKGKLIAADTIENLSKKLADKWKVTVEFELLGASSDLIREIEGIKGVTSVNQENNKIFVHMETDKSKEISETVMKHGATILLMKPKEHSLDEIFLEYLKESD